MMVPVGGMWLWVIGLIIISSRVKWDLWCCDNVLDALWIRYNRQAWTAMIKTCAWMDLGFRVVSPPTTRGLFLRSRCAPPSRSARATPGPPPRPLKHASTVRHRDHHWNTNHHRCANTQTSLNGCKPWPRRSLFVFSPFIRSRKPMMLFVSQAFYRNLLATKHVRELLFEEILPAAEAEVRTHLLCIRIVTISPQEHTDGLHLTFQRTTREFWRWSSRLDPPRFFSWDPACWPSTCHSLPRQNADPQIWMSKLLCCIYLRCGQWCLNNDLDKGSG